MDQSENTRQLNAKIEYLAMQVASNRANVAKWDVNLLIFLFAILATIIILTAQGVGLAIVAPLAVFGLAMGWLVGWRQGRRLYQRFYDEELSNLQEKPAAEVATTVEQVSPREKEILSYLAQGYANKRIATELGISEQTVKNHVTSVLRRLHASDRTEAVVIAIKRGLISV
ncbi:MAG: response regulator transcription factor [Chloroflexi bacterium]|nr:response regulator transcription factor [Chloroflexota bacterium]